jgi:hypothetical protein
MAATRSSRNREFFRLESLKLFILVNLPALATCGSCDEHNAWGEEEAKGDYLLIGPLHDVVFCYVAHAILRG